MNDLWIIFFKYIEESLVLTDQFTRIKTSFFEILKKIFKNTLCG